MNKNNFMKNLLIFVLICFIPLTALAGCDNPSTPNSNTFVAELVISPSTITQSFSFPANAEHFKNAGASEEEIDKYLSELTSGINIFYNIWQANFSLSKNPEKDESLEFGNGEATKTPPHYEAKTDSVDFSFSFTNEAWSYYHYKSDDEKDYSAEQDNIFTITTNSSGKFIFSQVLGEKSLGQSEYDLVKNVQVANFGDNIEGLDEVIFEYDYVTYHRRIKSNSDESFDDGSYRYHIWRSGLNGLNEKGDIVLKVTNAVTGWWYLVALGGAIIATGIGIMIVFLQERNKKSKKVK